MSEKCPVTCNACPEATLGEGLLSDLTLSQQSASCDATEADAANFTALLSDASSVVSKLSLLVDKVNAKPCLFNGALWATAGRCTELALQTLAIALPPINHVETPGSPFSSPCITARGTAGTCVGYADKLCSASAHPTKNRVLQLLFAAHSGDNTTVYQTLNKVYDKVSEPEPHKFVKAFRTVQDCATECEQATKTSDVCASAPEPSDFSPAAIKHTITCAGLAKFDFFNMRYAGNADTLALSHDAGDLEVSDAVKTEEVNGWLNWNFMLAGKAPTQILLADPLLCCEDASNSRSKFPNVMLQRFAKPVDLTTWGFGDLETCKMQVHFKYRVCHQSEDSLQPISTNLVSSLLTNSGTCKRWFVRADATVRFAISQRRTFADAASCSGSS